MKNSIVKILFLIVAANYFDTACANLKNEPAKIDDKIVGGSVINIRRVPYQVYLRIVTSDSFGTCGGSIISQRFILTAAHCLTKAEKILVLIATTDITKGGILYTATSWTIHPDYNYTTIDRDVGLVYIKEGIVLDGLNSKTVRLASENMGLYVGSNVLVTGWGALESDGWLPSNLMGVELPVLDHEECKEAYSWLTDRMFCAGYVEGGQDACQGDSGGPAVLTETGVQVGVVSFGNGCAKQGFPGVYAYIGDPSIREFIKSFADV